MIRYFDNVNIFIGIQISCLSSHPHLHDRLPVSCEDVDVIIAFAFHCHSVLHLYNGFKKIIKLTFLISSLEKKTGVSK